MRKIGVLALVRPGSYTCGGEESFTAVSVKVGAKSGGVRHPFWPVTACGAPRANYLDPFTPRVVKPGARWARCPSPAGAPAGVRRGGEGHREARRVRRRAETGGAGSQAAGGRERAHLA